MYDVIKVDMIKFLMGMFESCITKPNGIKQFKNQVEALVNRNQIPFEVRDIVYDIYGIMNQDFYKENQQKNKLMQINYLMMSVENLKSDSELEVFKKELNANLRNGVVLKSAYDSIVKIYDLDLVTSKIPLMVNNNTKDTKKPIKYNYKNNKSVNTDLNVVDEAVKADIDSIKSQYLNDAYYRYPNPSYDGCSGSSPYSYKSLLSVKEKPDGAVLCIRVKLHDDGCHVSYTYKPVTSEHLK